jgi:hypothetical protein
MSVYHAATQKAGAAMTFTVKTATDPLAMIPAIRHELADLDPLLPLTRTVTMEQRLSDSLATFWRKSRFSWICPNWEDRRSQGKYLLMRYC